MTRRFKSLWLVRAQKEKERSDLITEKVTICHLNERQYNVQMHTHTHACMQADVSTYLHPVLTELIVLFLHSSRLVDSLNKCKHMYKSTLCSAASFKHVYFSTSYESLCLLSSHYAAFQTEVKLLLTCPTWICSVVCFREGWQEHGECGGNTSAMCVILGFTDVYYQRKSSALALDRNLRLCP